MVRRLAPSAEVEPFQAPETAGCGCNMVYDKAGCRSRTSRPDCINPTPPVQTTQYTFPAGARGLPPLLNPFSLPPLGSPIS